MTPDDVRAIVREVAKPSRYAWCRQNNVARSHLSEFMSGKRDKPCTDLLDALGLEWQIARKVSDQPEMHER